MKKLLFVVAALAPFVGHAAILPVLTTTVGGQSISIPLTPTFSYGDESGAIFDTGVTPAGYEVSGSLVTVVNPGFEELNFTVYFSNNSGNTLKFTNSLGLAIDFDYFGLASGELTGTSVDSTLPVNVSFTETASVGNDSSGLPNTPYETLSGSCSGPAAPGGVGCGPPSLNPPGTVVSPFPKGFLVGSYTGEVADGNRIGEAETLRIYNLVPEPGTIGLAAAALMLLALVRRR